MKVSSSVKASPQHSSYSSIEGSGKSRWRTKFGLLVTERSLQERSSTEMEVQGSSWSACEKKVTEKMKDYLNKHGSVEVEVEGVGVSAWPRRLESGFQADLGGSNEQKGSHNF